MKDMGYSVLADPLCREIAQEEQEALKLQKIKNKNEHFRQNKS